MKSFLICLIAAAALTIGLEGALGNPSSPAASQAANEQNEYSIPTSRYQTAPAPPSSNGDYGY